MLTERIGPATDQLGAFLDLLEQLTRLRLEHKARAKAADTPSDRRSYHEAMQSAMKVLINSFYGTLGAGFASFCDGAAAARVAARGREILDLLLEELRSRDATLLEADTDGVLFSLPARQDGQPWTYPEELALIEDVARTMPAGIQLEHDGRYAAMYSYMEKNYALLDYETGITPGFRQRDPIRLVGSAFRSSRSEPFIEQALAEILALILHGRAEDVRGAFRAWCGALRRHEVPTPDVCVSMPLNKTPESYAQSGRKEEAYEVYLAAGNADWKQAHRVHYYQAKSGKRLLAPDARDYDADYYIDKLAGVCKQRLEKAFAPAYVQLLFSEFDGLFDPPLSEVHTIVVTSRTPITWDAEAGATDDQLANELGGPDGAGEPLTD